MNKSSKHHFWEWFRRHNREFLALTNKSKKESAYWVNELNAHLRACFKGLGFSLEWEEQKANLIITVNGKAMHFKKAEDLVAKAPKIPGWAFVALEDPRPIDFLLEQQIQETGIDPREMFFSVERNRTPHTVALIVYHPLCAPENEQLIYQLANTAVYNLLGERCFGKSISRLRVANLSGTDAGNIEKLEELPARIELRRSVMAVDCNGDLVIMD